MANSKVLNKFSEDFKLEMLPEIFFDKNQIEITTPHCKIELSAKGCLPLFKLSNLKKMQEEKNPLLKLEKTFSNEVKVP